MRILVKPFRLSLAAFLAAATAIFLTPQAVQANAGVPMIFLTLPGMTLALVPVILLEMLVLSSRLRISRGSALKVSCAANAFTTFVGFPLTWLALLVLEMVTGGGNAYGLGDTLHKILAVTWQAPWMIPYEDNRNLDWMVPAAAMWLLIPSFFTSWWLELRVAARMLPDAPRAWVKSAVLRANLLTYALLEALVLGYFLYVVLWVL